MTAAPFDTLKLSRQLRERAHFDQDQAEGVAEAFQEQIATKTDLAAMPPTFDAWKGLQP